MVVRIGLTTGRKRCYWVCKERNLQTCLFKGIIYGFPLKWKTVSLVLAPVCQNFERNTVLAVVMYLKWDSLMAQR